MCLKRFAVNTCPNCSGHLAAIDNGLRECEQCGRIQGQGIIMKKGSNPPPPPIEQKPSPPPAPPRISSSAAKPQPMPTVGRQDVLPGIIADLQARTDEGIRKYGTPLQTHNSRDALIDAYQEALDLCQYLKQALMERDNPMPTWNWPETVFVRCNNLDQQLTHILSEVDEIDALRPWITPMMHQELADLHHRVETLWQILGRQAGEDYVAAVFRAVEDKNRARGYYDLDGGSARVDQIEGPFGQMPNLED